MPDGLPMDELSLIEPPPRILGRATPPILPPPVQVVPIARGRTADDEHQRFRQRETKFWILTAIPSGMCSAIIHLLVLIALAICIVTTQMGTSPISLEVVQLEAVHQEVPLELPTQMQVLPEIENNDSPIWDGDLFDGGKDQAPVFQEPVLASMNRQVSAQPLFTVGHSAAEFGQTSHSDGHLGESLASRTERRRFAAWNGASAESERAVELALSWIIRHQKSDGSWSFRHEKGARLCTRCRCRHPGSQANAKNGATAMGLLSLLGAGYTHAQGKYQEHVTQGLRFLIDNQGRNGSFCDPDGNMYSHGLATLALCEALAMTRQYSPAPNAKPEKAESTQTATSARQPSLGLLADSMPSANDLFKSNGPSNRSNSRTITLAELESAAQRAIQFIERAQHSEGGWRYQPGQAGDTSIVGWQLMALKSGYLAGLQIDSNILEKAVSFLDSVSEDEIGSCYSYMTCTPVAQLPFDKTIRSTTPIGLLCRMYTGWERDREGIIVGVQRLRRWARPDQGMYFYYYATQVMHHYGGIQWQEWNTWMRNYLVREQSVVGSETGSWKFSGSHDDAGRFYCTAMAAMTLEIYYRYVPIYSDRAVTVSDVAPE